MATKPFDAVMPVVVAGQLDFAVLPSSIGFPPELNSTTTTRFGVDTQELSNILRDYEFIAVKNRIES